MSMELITIIATIISANIALAGVIIRFIVRTMITGQNSLHRELQAQRKELQAQREELQAQREELQAQRRELQAHREENQAEFKAMRAEIEGVKIEVASLRATVETYFRVRVDPPPTAAVGEAPEDYGAD